MRFMAILFGSLLVLQMAATALPPSIAPPSYSVAEAKGRSAPKPPRQRKSPEPEPMTYERAMELEKKRHEKNLADIRYHYRFHKPMRKYRERQENEFHAKRVEEIKKKYGML